MYFLNTKVVAFFIVGQDPFRVENTSPKVLQMIGMRTVTIIEIAVFL